MKKILNVIGSLRIGGAENNAMAILRHLNPQDYEYHFLVFDQEVGDYEAEARQLGATIHRLPEPKAAYRDFIHHFRRLLQEEQFQVIHVNTLWNSGLLLKIAAQEQIPLRICHSHSTQSSAQEHLVYKVYKRLMQAWIRRYATHYIACGQAAGEYLYGTKFFEQHGQIIYNAIDLSIFKFDKSVRQKMRDQLQINSQTFVLGHTGRLAPVKNHPFMLKILKVLRDQGRQVVLMLIGDGPDRDKIVQLVKTLELEEAVYLLGRQHNIVEWLQAMDLFIFPSFFEGFPVSLVEAQATGLTALLSDRVSSEALLTPFSQALPLSQIETWISQIEAEINQPTDRTQTNLKKIQSSFDIDYVIHDWEGLYEEI